jgi:hypothetical protein
MAGTTPGAERFITGAISIEEQARAAESTARAAELTAHAAELRTVPVQPPGLSKETGRRLEATLNPAVKAAPALVPSAATAMADRPRAIRHAEAPVSVAEQRMAAGQRTAAVAEDLTVVAVADVIKRSAVMFLVV